MIPTFLMFKLVTSIILKYQRNSSVGNIQNSLILSRLEDISFQLDSTEKLKLILMLIRRNIKTKRNIKLAKDQSWMVYHKVMMKKMPSTAHLSMLLPILRKQPSLETMTRSLFLLKMTLVTQKTGMIILIKTKTCLIPDKSRSWVTSATWCTLTIKISRRVTNLKVQTARKNKQILRFKWKSKNQEATTKETKTEPT